MWLWSGGLRCDIAIDTAIEILVFIILLHLAVHLEIAVSDLVFQNAGWKSFADR